MSGSKSPSSQVKSNIDLKQQKKKSSCEGNKKGKVKQCNNETDDEKNLGDIKEEVHTESCSCQMCSQKFKKKDRSSYQHNLRATKNRFECVEWNEKFIKETGKQEHLLTCERIDEHSELQCCFSDLTYDASKDLKAHEKKHCLIQKTKNCKNICVCAECKKGFDSIPLLKAHIQREHTKNESHTNEEIKDELDAQWINVTNLTNPLQYREESQPGKKSSFIQIPDDVSKEYLEKDKPFLCSQCGSRYKYEKSKLKHELKYHGTVMEVGRQCEEFQWNEHSKTSQVSNQDGYKFETEYKGKDPENEVIKFRNSVNNVKAENVPVGDEAARDIPNKKPSVRSHSVRNAIIKKKCIGCDKVFDGPKERDEHELQCGLNFFNRKFNCMFCDHPFSKPRALRRHENKHRPARKTKKYKNRCVCIECNKTFDAIYSLRVHMKKLHRKVHAEPVQNKPFACGVCDSRFKYENSKYRHEMRYHSAETVRYSSGDGIFTNLGLDMLSNTVPDVYTVESSYSDYVKEECGEYNPGYRTGSKTINPVCSVMEVDAMVDTTLTVVGGVEAEDNIPRRKRKGKEPVEKKPRKQKTGPFVCNNCEAKFNSPQGLWLHSYHQNMRTKRLSCIGCGKTFKSEKDTEEHELMCDLNHNEYDFDCMFCNEAFGTPKLLRNHELKHRPRRRTKNHKCVCIDCRRPFDSIQSLKEHVRECRKNHVKVEEVDPQFSEQSLPMEEMKPCYVLLKDIGLTAAGFRKSKRTDADDSAELETQQCSVEIKEEVDGNGAVCDVTGGKTEDMADYLIEAPAYLVEAELANPDGAMQPEGTECFRCGKCTSKFDSYEKLRCHSYSHRQRMKRLFCIGCGQGFEQGNDRDKHELQCSVNLSNGYFKCIFCELPFDTPQSLRNHEKKHRPPKRYKRYRHMCLCAECDRAFDAVLTLKVHIQHVHRGSKEKTMIKEEVENGNFEGDHTHLRGEMSVVK